MTTKTTPTTPRGRRVRPPTESSSSKVISSSPHRRGILSMPSPPPASSSLPFVNAVVVVAVLLLLLLLLLCPTAVVDGGGNDILPDIPSNFAMRRPVVPSHPPHRATWKVDDGPAALSAGAGGDDDDYDDDGGGGVRGGYVEAASYERQRRPPNSPYEYVPVSALDDYGRSAQLRHASLSHARHGTTVIACVCRGQVVGERCVARRTSEGEDEREINDILDDDDDDVVVVEDAIVVCSLRRRRPGIIAGGGGASSLPGMVRILATEDDNVYDDDDDDDDRNEYGDDDDDGKEVDDCHAHDADHDDVGSSIVKRDVPSSSTATETNHCRRRPSRTTPSHALRVAMVASGIRSDADYLTMKLRSHLNRHWFRYDAYPRGDAHSSSSSKMIGDVLLDFMGYDRDIEACGSGVSGGIGSAAGGGGGGGGDDDDDDGTMRAGRPLGVCAFLLEMDDDDDDDDEGPPRRMRWQGAGRGRCDRNGRGGHGLHRRNPPSFTVIEANGLSRRYAARAMGIGSDVANAELARLWRRDMEYNEVVDMMGGIMRGIVVGGGDGVGGGDRGGGGGGYTPSSTTATATDTNTEDENAGDNSDGEYMLVCETVTSRGIDVRYVAL